MRIKWWKIKLVFAVSENRFSYFWQMKNRWILSNNLIHVKFSLFSILSAPSVASARFERVSMDGDVESDRSIVHFIYLYFEFTSKLFHLLFRLCHLYFSSYSLMRTHLFVFFLFALDLLAVFFCKSTKGKVDVKKKHAKHAASTKENHFIRVV